MDGDLLKHRSVAGLWVTKENQGDERKPKTARRPGICPSRGKVKKWTGLNVLQTR